MGCSLLILILDVLLLKNNPLLVAGENNKHLKKTLDKKEETILFTGLILMWEFKHCYEVNDSFAQQIPCL